MPAPSLSFDRIVLTGFMGSGKSTVGRLLAVELGWRFVDLDAAIEEREGVTVPEIFARCGEPHFREAEQRALGEILSVRRTVLALGGGAVETPANHALLRAAARTAVVHLGAPFEMLYARCSAQAQDPAATSRPNLATREGAQQRFLARDPLYAAMATHTVATAELSAQQTVSEILRMLDAAA